MAGPGGESADLVLPERGCKALMDSSIHRNWSRHNPPPSGRQGNASRPSRRPQPPLASDSGARPQRLRWRAGAPPDLSFSTTAPPAPPPRALHYLDEPGQHRNPPAPCSAVPNERVALKLKRCALFRWSAAEIPREPEERRWAEGRSLAPSFARAFRLDLPRRPSGLPILSTKAPTTVCSAAQWAGRWVAARDARA